MMMAGNPPHLNETRPFRTNTAIRDLFEGRSNAVGNVTLRANETTTVVTNLVSGSASKVFLFPTTAAGGVSLATGALYISAAGAGTFTITHTSTADVDKSFFWVALG